MIGLASQYEGLYYLEVDTKKVHVSNIWNEGSETIPEEALWHFRLGHLSNSPLSLMNSQFPFVRVDRNSVCDVCHYARHKKLPYSLSLNKVSTPYELIHFDIWGPISVQSVNGHKYFLTALDDFSRFTWVILLKAKSEVSQLVQEFITMIEK